MSKVTVILPRGCSESLRREAIHGLQRRGFVVKSNHGQQYAEVIDPDERRGWPGYQRFRREMRRLGLTPDDDGPGAA